MTPFDEIGARIDREWRRLDFDPSALPALAAGALVDAALPTRIAGADILSWIGRSPRPPAQRADDGFGEPAVVVYEHPRFFVQALFWHTGTTSIHQHAFGGAFLVLEGRSLQARYDFQRLRAVDDGVALGTLTLRDARVATPGDVEQIPAGPALIHSVLHLGSPSVTIVVRSYRDEHAGPQLDYRRPHLAIAPGRPDPLTVRRLQALSLLRTTNRSSYLAAVAEFIDASDILGTFQLFARSYGLLREGDMEPELARARQRHGDELDLVLAVLEEAERERILVDLRQRVVEEELRFLLGALAILPSRAAVLDAVSGFAPERPPLDTLTRWLGALSDRGLIGIDLDDLNTTLLRGLLAGTSADELLHDLAADYGDEQVRAHRGALVEHCRALRSHRLLKPLFTEAT